MRFTTITVLLALITTLLVLQGCGYRPLISQTAAIEVAAIQTRVPEPELTACLTRELRVGLAARLPQRRGGDEFVLRGEILSVNVAPAELARTRSGLRPIDQGVGLVLQVRLIGPDGSTVFGPTNYQVRERALEGPDPVSSHSAAGSGLSRACTRAAQQVVDDILFELIEWY